MAANLVHRAFERLHEHDVRVLLDAHVAGIPAAMPVLPSGIGGVGIGSTVTADA